MDSVPVPREDGRFVKGHSGNPAGRPPNSKNKLSNLRKELELALVEHIGIERLKRIINKVAEKAEAGDMRAAKLLLDKTVPNASPSDETQDNGRQVVFRIVNATFAAQQQQLEQQDPNAIDVQVTDVTKQEIPSEQ
jgi:hypothetical protein